MTTKDRLAQALREAHAPDDMVLKAVGGYYDDYESPLATPIMQLARDCNEHRLWHLEKRVKAGEFDGTREESEAWYEREGKHLMEER